MASERGAGPGLKGIRRVAVVGCGGAGKSTFSRRLGELLDLPVVHLDRHYWRPGWVETPDEDFRATQRALVRAERWVIDGNYAGTMDVRLPVADLIVFLDFPRWRCLFRVARRTVRGWGRDGQAPGCPERLDWEFLRWLWDWPRDARPRVLARLDEHGARARRITLSTPREVRDFLGRLRSGDRPRGE
ncbi:DNA topology modulation protein FlaR [Amycolatopsis pigmentata]|uniref:DNA topology modulation protein FlaR n=1 Tax=Amycolatopsis pigmentata TaxID=450801 RepID=A0ABW5FSE3_9PSEU